MRRRPGAAPARAPRITLHPGSAALITCLTGCMDYALKLDVEPVDAPGDTAAGVSGGETGEADGAATGFDPTGESTGVVVDPGDTAFPVLVLRVELPCGAKSGDGCDAGSDDDAGSFRLGASGTHAVQVLVRGVAEAKLYSGGTNDGAFLQVGGTPDPLGYNEYSVVVSSPPGVWYLNRGTDWLRFCFELNYSFTAEIDEGATVTLRADSMDAAQIINQDADLEAIVVSGIAPAPDAFDGQFVQLDLAAIAR